jgi:hypothetical protein
MEGATQRNALGPSRVRKSNNWGEQCSVAPPASIFQYHG